MPVRAPVHRAEHHGNGAAVNRRAPLVALVGVSGISALGLAMTLLAIPWFVLRVSGSGTQTALVAASETLGLLVSAVFGGPVVDRVGARRASIGADGLTAMAVVAMPVAHATLGLSLPAAVVLTFAMGLTRGPADTAKQVLVAEAIALAGTSVERGTGSFEGGRRIGTMLGAPLAGALIATIGPVPVLYVDAAALLLSAVLVLTLVPRPRTAPPPTATSSDNGYMRHLRDGFRFLRHDRLLLALTAMLLVTNAMDGGLNGVLYPAYGARVLHSSTLLGALVTASGVGALTGATLYGWTGHRWSRRAVFALCFAVVGAPRFLLLAAGPPPALLLPALVICGLGSGMLTPVMMAVVYDRIPSRLQGRTLSLIVACALAAIPVGQLAAGVLLDHVGLAPALLVFGCTYLVATMFPFTFPVWHEMDTRRSPQGPEANDGGARAAAQSRPH
ncbi:major facilitator superfamily permease [Streptomyces noursei]|nr:major facilitator superfamily permease [Streptomyces noursei]